MTRTRIAIAALAIISLAIIVVMVTRGRTAPAVVVAESPSTQGPSAFLSDSARAVSGDYPEKVQKITGLLEAAPTSRPSAADTAELFEQVLHDSDFRIRVRAMAVLPFVNERERAIDILISCVHDRNPETSGGGNVPLYATTYLADMNATRAIPDVVDWVNFLEKHPLSDGKLQAMVLKKSREDLARLQEAATTRPVANGEHPSPPKP